MKPAAERLRERLANIAIGPPAVPVVQNRDVQAFDEPERIRQALVEQLYHPVRWIETVHFLSAHGVLRMVECGPGKVLAGLSRRIAGKAEVLALNNTAELVAAATKG